jgi:predicted transcriptional regulator
MHIELDDELVRRIDGVAGHRGRSTFVRRAIAAALEQAERWELIRSARGSIPDAGHDWDDDPAAWVHAQRFSDDRRVG